MASSGNMAREYLRVSIDKSGRERSPEEQHHDHQGAAAERGWTLGKPYKDVGSASRYATKARKDFDRLTADLKAGRFAAQILILWEGSRGSRRTGEWADLIDLLEECHVKVFIFTYERLFDPANPYDRAELLRLAVTSELSSAETSKRAKRAAAATARDGKPSGRIPFGYRRIYDPITRQLVKQEPEPAEAKVIKELFDRISHGHSLRSIAIDFEKRGVRTRTGIVFTAQHLRSLATTHTYAGLRVHDPDRHKVKTRLSSKATFIEATWPPLVKRAMFLAVQRLLTAPERVTTRPGRAKHLLSMIAVCDVCGGPLAARNNNHDRTRLGEMDYQCHKGGHIRIDYRELNLLAEKAMVGWLARPVNVARLTAGVEESGIDAAREQIAVIRAELDDLADKVGRGALSATLAARAEPGILARLKAAELAEQELSTPNVLRGLISPGADVARRWKAAPMSTRREVARILFSPNILGELRVARSATPGHRCPVEDRVIWRRTTSDVSKKRV